MHKLRVAAMIAALGGSLAAQTIDLTQQPVSSKLSTVLADLVAAQRQTTARLKTEEMPSSVRDAVRGGLLRINDANEVQVYVLVTEVTDAVVAQLQSAGATIEISDAAARRVQARIAVAQLQTVAQLAPVTAIRLPTYARHRTGNFTTEGDAILHADATRADYGVDGTNVRVGVISDGLKGVFATGCVACTGDTNGPMPTGDLPTAAGTRNASGVLTSSAGGIIGKSFQANQDLEGLPPSGSSCAFAGAGAEGTALLEIVHDLAPGAKLSFANADTDLAFTQAVNFLAASNDVVLDDIGFYGEPYDGTSVVSRNTAAALNNNTFPIRAYVTSVGNDADEHYYGTYTDSNVDGTTIAGVANAGHLHLFQRAGDTGDALGLGSQPYNAIQLPQNGEVVIFLSWDDPFGGSRNNYDLYLVRQSTNQVVASSRDIQNGGQDPVETIDYVNNGAADRFRIVVQNVNNAAQPKTLNLFSFEPECAAAGPVVLAPPRHERLNYNTPTHSVSAQSDAGGSPVSVISVGAICSASAAAAGNFPSSNPDESCLDTSHSTAEFFSSRGPTLDGRNKPDIAAIDGVTISGSGKFPAPFFGTSAASPHVGAIAALLLQGAPCLLNRSTSTTDPASARATVRSTLLGTADPLSATVPDNTFGAGIVDAHAAVAKMRPSWNGQTATFTFDGNSAFGASITAAQLGFTDPNGCALTALSWTGGCGTSPGTTMTCGFGANAVNVAASNNNVGFSAGVDFTINVTDFAIDASPTSATVSAGQSATYTVTISPQTGAYNTPIALSCNTGALPPQTTCSFNPSTVTPGAGPAKASLTVTTSAASASASIAGTIRTKASGVALFPSGVDFGTQIINTTSPPHVIALTNTGADPLSITSIGTAGDFAQTNSCGTSLASGASCQISILFTPTATGTRSGSLTVSDNATGSPHTTTLTGNGASAPAAGSATPSGTYSIAVLGTVGTLTHSVNLTLAVQ
jgi:hypothetical protein